MFRILITALIVAVFALQPSAFAQENQPENQEGTAEKAEEKPKGDPVTGHIPAEILTPDHWNPLQKYAYKGNEEAILLLLENGEDINGGDEKFNETPLHIAATAGQSEITELLLKEGADIQARSMSEKTPLHKAVFFGQFDTVKLLVEKGADVNARDKSGYTPLHSSASNRASLEIAKFLLEKGADPNAKSKYGDVRPIDLAKQQKRNDLAKLLAPITEELPQKTSGTIEETPIPEGGLPVIEEKENKE